MKKSISNEKKFDITGIKEIYVSTSSPDINIIPTDDTEVKAHLHGNVKAKSEEYIPNLVCSNSNSKILIELKRTQNSSFNIFNFGSWSGDLILDVYIPREYSNCIVSKVSSGNLDIKNLEVSNLTCKSSSGNIVIKSVKAKTGKINASSGTITIDELEGQFQISSSSGTINLSHCIGSLNLSASSGKINASNLRGNLESSTSSGTAYIQYDKLDNINTNITTSSGSVKLNIPEDSQFNIETKTSSGSINTDFPIVVKNTIKRNDLEGKVGENPNSNVAIKTSSGNIYINKC